MAQQRNLSALGLAAPLALNLGGQGNTSQVASGTTNADATALAGDLVTLATVAAGTGVILPAMNQGDWVVVGNQGANALLVYPPSGGQINALTRTTGGFSVTAAKAASFYCVSAAQFIAILSA
jgi:hypothetical protein